MTNVFLSKHNRIHSFLSFNKLIFFIFVHIGTVFIGHSQMDSMVSITVTINHIHNNKGHVILALHNADTFMRSEGIQTKSENIVDGKITATFTGVSPGDYAILAMHDENDNERMDFEANGMPIESYGMSNNPMHFGPPEFQSAKFKVDTKDLEMTIIF